MIGKTVDISVTSVLQTTAGKMIFGKFDERGISSMARPEPRPPDLRKSNPQPSLVPDNSNSSAGSSSGAGAIAPANGTTEPH
jgi:hypothetical protein